MWDKIFAFGLPPNLSIAKDIFTLRLLCRPWGLDLSSFKKIHLVTDEYDHYPIKYSIKTGTDTRIKLPEQDSFNLFQK